MAFVGIITSALWCACLQRCQGTTGLRTSILTSASRGSVLKRWARATGRRWCVACRSPSSRWRSTSAWDRKGSPGAASTELQATTAPSFSGESPTRQLTDFDQTRCLSFYEETKLLQNVSSFYRRSAGLWPRLKIHRANLYQLVVRVPLLNRGLICVGPETPLGKRRHILTMSVGRT